MADNRSFVIVGAGLAGAKAAETLRTEGFTGRVVLLVLCALCGVATIGESLLSVVVGASFLAGAVGDWRSGGS